jgi:vacuolar-type H+-ATPase subunit I/STV1
LTDSTIFDSQSTNEGNQQAPQPQGFQIPTEAVDYIGSGKKYQTPEDALKSVPHAQKHIQTLEQELASVKEELTKRRTAQELLDEIKSGLPQENTPQAVEFDQDRLAQIIDQTLSAKEQQRTAKQNAQAVTQEFTKVYGDKAEEVYLSIARDSGLSVQQLNSLAASSPSAVLKLAGLTKSTVGVATKSSGNINTETFSNNSQQQLSARVPKGATTRDLVSAWKIAGEKVKQKLSTS